MRAAFGRRQLGLEKCRDEEARAGKFDGAELAVVIKCGEIETRGSEVRQVSWVHLVIAEILLFRFQTPIDLREPGAGFDPQAACTRQLWATREPVGRGTRHRMDDETSRIGLVLGRIRVGDS